MYLNNWAVDNKVWVYNLLVSHEKVPVWVSKPVAGIAFYDNLYTSVKDGVETDKLEHEFSEKYETPAKKPIDKILHNEKMNSDDWKHLSLFAAAQFVRTPAFFQKNRKIITNIVINSFNKVCDKLSALKAPPKDDIAVSDNASMLPISIKDTGIRINNEALLEVNMIDGRSIWYMLIQHFLAPNSDYLNSFLDMKWSIVSCPEGHYFPTSDNPIFLVCKDKNGNLVKSEGITKKNNMILFPLSPEKLLIGKMKNRLPYRFTLSEAEYVNYKKQILSNAFLYVYADRKDDSIPNIRSRVINDDEFKRIQESYKEWYPSYIKHEVPLLRKKEETT